MKKIKIGLKRLSIALLLCLCTAQLSSFAFTETSDRAADLVNTERHDGIQSSCILPDGRVVFAGFTEIRTDSNESTGRLICVNPDRTVSWTYTDSDTFGYGKVVLTADNLIAAYYFDGVKFFTPDGQPTGKNIALIYTSGNMYDITARGILRSQRKDDEETAGFLEFVSWNNQLLFRIDEPESMWVGTPPLADEDGLVLLGQEAGDLKQAAAKIMKVDLQGNTVWETKLPFLSEDRDYTGAGYGVRTSDGSYLAILWDMKYNPEDDSYNSNHALVKLDSNGKLLWMKQPASTLWDLTEYDGKYVAYSLHTDPETGTDVVRYLWLDTDGNELGTTELRIREEYVPPYVNMEQCAVSGEKLFPMNDGLWQMISFLDPDDPKDPETAWGTQDSLLVRVPELGAEGQ